MGDRTGIEWTDATWNPVVGCSHASPGCDHCYAERQAGRMVRIGHAPQYEGTVHMDGEGGWTGWLNMAHDGVVEQPVRWRRPRRVFVCSMSDLFHPQVPEGWIARVFAVMARAPHHTFQVLTKRPKRMAALLASPRFELAVRATVARSVTSTDDHLDPLHPWPLSNVWAGTSIESNAYAWRADALRATPASVHWISAEPLLGPLDELDLTGIDWLVAGGESGPDARPMHPDWVRDLRDRCTEWDVSDEFDDGTRIAFLFKQWGAWWPAAKVHPDHDDEAEMDAWDALDVEAHQMALEPTGVVAQAMGGPEGDWCDAQPHIDAWWMTRVGKKAAGRELDGRTWDEYPEVAV